MRPIPSYVRAKLAKGNVTRQNEYYQQRLSTPRSGNLRR